MRISDWSSDVCSSDLALVEAVEAGAGARRHLQGIGHAGRGLLAGEQVGLVEQPQRRRHAGNRGFQLDAAGIRVAGVKSEEHTSELQSLMRFSYAVLCLKKKNNPQTCISDTNQLY